MTKNKFYGTLDRIEGDTAVILAEEGCATIEIPKHLLPSNCKEGGLVSFTIEIKDKKTREEKEKVDRLIKKLAHRNV